VAFSLGRAKRMMLIFLAVLAAVWLLMAKLPTSFLPDEDQGFVYVNVNLPSGASDARLQEVLDQVREYLAKQPDVISFNQVSGLNGDQSSARGFIRLKPWSMRPLPSQSAAAIANKATRSWPHPRCARAGGAAACSARPGFELGLQLHDQGHQRCGPRGAARRARSGAWRNARQQSADGRAHHQSGRRQRAARGCG
jgi:multidrug efflux pump subunit AcrB